jgi:hypothetical protein
MTAQHTGCTIYFHTSKRYSTIHFATTSSWNVSSFCGLYQPNLVKLVMSGNPAGRVKGTAPAGTPGMAFAAFWILFIIVVKSSWRPNLPNKPPRPGGVLGLVGVPGPRIGTGVGRGPAVKRGGFGKGGSVIRPNWGSASTMAAKAARATITCQIESMVLSIGTCTVLCVCWMLVS